MELKELKAKLKKKREKDLLIDLWIIEYTRAKYGTLYPTTDFLDRMAEGDKVVDTRKILTEKDTQ